MTHRALMGVSLVGLLLATAGCAELLGPVTGKVTLNGNVLDGATIVFHPVESGGGKGSPRQAAGLTNKEGKYSLETVNDKGIAPGEYKITIIRKMLPPGVKPADSKNMVDMMQTTAKMKESVPKEYTSTATTPLKFTVPKGGQKDVDWNLTGKGEIDWPSSSSAPPSGSPTDDKKPAEKK